MNKIDRRKAMIGIANNFHALRHQVMAGKNEIRPDMKITSSQMALIFMINHHKNITLSEIAENLSISKSAVTQLIDNLVKLDLVQKQNDSTDRRVNNLVVTKKTKKYMDEMHNYFIEKISTVFEVLGDDDLAELNRITNLLLTKKG